MTLWPSQLPDFITHYSRGTPFRSMTSIPQEAWPIVLEELNETNAWGFSRFSDHEYLPQRLALEKRMHDDFKAKGGNPETEFPSYFFLGRHSRFETHPLNKAYFIRLVDLPPHVVSFTYGDSMLGLIEASRAIAGEAYKNPLCQSIYTMDEVSELITNPHYPRENPLHIEAQLWITPSPEIVKLVAPGPK